MSEDTIVIRQGHLNDCNDIVRMIEELAKSEGIVSQLANRDIDEVSTLQSDGFGEEAPWFHTLVAEAADGRLVGMSLFSFCYSMISGRCIHVESLYVVPELRGQGIGTRLWYETTKAGLSKGCRRLEFAALEKNVRALKFYSRFGATDFTTEVGAHLLFLSEESMKKLIVTVKDTGTPMD